MIKLYVAEHGFSMSLSKYGLRIWDQFLNYSDSLIGYRKELDLDIVIANVPNRVFDTNASDDPKAGLVEAFERGRVIAQRLPQSRMKWITLCGHHRSITPDRNKPVHFSSLGYESIGAIALYEGGIDFITRDGEVICNGQWESAEEYFLRLLSVYGLLP